MSTRLCGCEVQECTDPLSGRDPHEITANGLGQEILGREDPGPSTGSVFSINLALGKIQKA